MSIAILKAIWGRQKGFVFLNTKHGTAWREHPFEYPKNIKDIERYVKEWEDKGHDLYWCPLVFKEPKRIKANVLPTANILWADLDEVNPDTLGDLTPSIAWASSDNRYQALWLLDDKHDVYEVEELNKDLTYSIGADKGGWDITQVLRIPGTKNHKYDPPQEGKLLWAKKRIYDFEDLKRDLGGAASSTKLTDVLKDWKIPQRIHDLLTADPSEVTVGERSDRLWEIETALVEAGVPVLTIVNVIKACPWNKFKGRRDEVDQIYKEVLKAEQHVKLREKPSAHTTVLKETNWAVPYDTFISKKTGKPEWLIKDIWQAGTYGMIAGEPKTYKSVLATDLALSVATGKPFLGVYEVMKRGSVLFVQEENNEQTVQDRVYKIANHKGLVTHTSDGIPIVESIPIRFSNNFGIDLTDDESRELLEDTIKDFSPVLVVLDPLYMMLGKAEENSATEVRDILRWLTYLRNTYGCAIIICHHYSKQKDGKARRGGTQIRGTSEFHAWVESALYIKTTTEQNTVEIEREFRAFPSMPQFTVKMELGEPGELYYRPMVKAAKFSVEMEVKKEDVLSWIASTPRTFEELKSITRYSRGELLRVLTELVDEGYVLKDEGIGRGKKTTYVMANLEVD